MRVLLLGKYSMPRNGGVQRHIASLMMGLHDIGGVQVQLLAANDSYGTTVERWNGFRTIRTSQLLNLNALPFSRAYPKWLSSLAEVVPFSPSYPLWLSKLKEVDVIHLHAPNPMVELSLLAINPSAPIVTTEHCAVTMDSRMASVYRRVHDEVLDRSDALIVQSPKLAEGGLLGPHHRQRINLIPSCIDPARMQEAPELAEALLRGYKVKRPVVLFVGRLVDYKGVDVLIKA